MCISARHSCPCAGAQLYELTNELNILTYLHMSPGSEKREQTTRLRFLQVLVQTEAPAQNLCPLVLGCLHLYILFGTILS